MLAVLLMLGGCAVPATPGDSGTAGPSAGPTAAPTSPGPSTEGSRSPGASETGTASGTQPGTQEPPSDWKTFTTSDGLAFDYPPDWTARDPGGDLGGAFVDVTNAAGKRMAELRTNIVTGAECIEQYPYRVFDSQPLQSLVEPGAADHAVPRFVFESRGDDTGPGPTRTTTAAYGITMMPEATGPLECPMFHLFLWPPSGALFGGTYDPAKNLTPGPPSLPYLEKAKLYASTPEYRLIRTMITSLRPANPAS